MMTKATIIAAAALGLLAPMPVLGAETLQLVFRTTDGSERRFEAANLEMKVVEQTLVVTNDSESQGFDLLSLDRMYFDGPTVDVEELLAANSDKPATVYTVDGARCGDYPTLESALGQLRAGVYVIVQPGKTSKIVVR